MIKKVSAVIILYEPLSAVKYNILSYIEYVECLYVVDNSNQLSDILFELSSNKIKVLHHGSNIGISKALNLALKQAQNDNYEWLITFDQDTYFDKKNDFKDFLEDFYKLNDKDIAIVSPLHNKRFIDKSASLYQEVDFVMTSSNCLNVDIAHRVGGFNELLFIDEVDHEFCLRLRRSGYKIYVNNHISVNHTLGVSHKWFFNIKIYNEIRLYYMVRNYLYLRSQYKIYHSDFFKQRDKYLIKFFFKQIVFGYKRVSNIKYIIRGIYDYLHNDFGKLS